MCPPSLLEQNGIDLNQFLQEIAVANAIPSDPTVWENRNAASVQAGGNSW